MLSCNSNYEYRPVSFKYDETWMRRLLAYRASYIKEKKVYLKSVATTATLAFVLAMQNDFTYYYYLYAVLCSYSCLLFHKKIEWFIIHCFSFSFFLYRFRFSPITNLLNLLLYRFFWNSTNSHCQFFSLLQFFFIRFPIHLQSCSASL